jgi:hypothetical protein
MISLKTARKLKEAGLKWEPQAGDMYHWESLTDGWEMRTVQECEIVNALYEIMELITEGEWLFAPRLDQLLAEIEKRGYAWELSVDEADKPPYAICIFSTPREIGQKWFTADSPEEAAALALLWILEQEAV